MRDRNEGEQQEASTSNYESTESIGGSSTATLEIMDSSSGVSSNSSTLSMEGCYDNPVLSIDEEVSARGVRLSLSACSSSANSLPSTSRSLDLNQNDLPRAERGPKRFTRIPWIMAIASNTDSDPMMSPLDLEKRPSCVPAYIVIFALLFILLAIGGITTLLDVRPAFFGLPANSTHSPALAHDPVLAPVANITLL
ncbi:hypothetical protein PRIPAC_91619 [Pristionchus pacificus]|uniref:Uncharacterized protein n=1 Tax=Pristionchus pacificus TaxID=54126 RepID=A0A2A6CDI7_PRIPA|nr:hypothetical protein PRIPAC_91619 [Pristionchus pacificus]|eukprot:PDM76272.1 hypothetical protein PRIPAC_39876 [Pristionchus pacificus]